ncbi:MAG TPA: SpoIIE family protein phosphatase [Methylococcaceae bacterium]|nr:SpoIIE family protein phosphatase [Methylococcaceae bacterium]
MKADLRDLISHRTSVQADQSVEAVYRLFAQHHFEFMAVLDGERLLGMCARREIGMLLGSRYGFSLFAQKPIRNHLKPDPACVATGTPVTEVFRTVFAREAGAFYDDVLLIGPAREFLGLIETQTLVKLQTRFHLESIRLLEEQQREITRKNEQIEADLCMSRELQQALLPDRYPVFPPETEPAASVLRFHHRYQPYGIVGGDFFHITRVSDMVAGVFIADVMGHGVRSALITAMLRALLEQLGPTVTDPGQLLAHLNGELTQILGQAGNDVMFATALYLLVDGAGDSVRYATAGHPFPLHVRCRAGIAETLHHPDPGTILGVFEDAVFLTHEKSVDPADSIILFTDGLFEVLDSSGREFGMQGLLKTIGSRTGEPTEELLEALLKDARQFSATNEFSDDVCLVAIDLNRQHRPVNGYGAR